MSLMDVAKTVASYAPFLGSVLAGQFGETIGQVVAEKFGGDIHAPEELLKKIKADPESYIKLREIEAQESANLQRLAFLQAELNFKNTDSARQANIKSDSSFPQILSLGVIVGFFSCLYWVAAFPQDGSDKDILNILLGVVGSAFAAVVNYWLGSSMMDRKK